VPYFSSCLLGLIALAMVGVAGPASANTLEEVTDRGLLRCGVMNGGIGLSEIDTSGHWRGFFPEFCRSLAAAVLGDAEAVEFIEVNNVVRFEALNSGAFDVLMSNTTWTTSRDAKLDLAFTHPLYFDGQGFLSHSSLGAASMSDVESASICVSEGTTTIQNLRELVSKHPGTLKVVSFQSIEQVYESFFSRECDLLTYDRIVLMSQRLNRAADPDDFILFTDIISKEPLGPVVRGDDQDWFDVVQWVMYATLIAEEHGISKATLDAYLDSEVPEVRRLLGLDPGMGDTLGLREDWALQALRQVGSYKDIYDRTLGEESSMKLDRGLNALWTDGGLMYPPPLR
jgi:general L-amino acid transport system substrate-binding protein